MRSHQADTGVDKKAPGTATGVIGGDKQRHGGNVPAFKGDIQRLHGLDLLFGFRRAPQRLLTWGGNRPGTMQLTRMPDGPSSRASVWLSPTIAAFDVV
jgi:hypothetical protein